MAEKDSDDLDVAAVSEQIRRTVLGIDLLFLAYAKAENMFPDPDERFEELRSFWGDFARGLIREAVKAEQLG